MTASVGPSCVGGAQRVAACNNHRCIISLAVAGEDHSEAGAQDLVFEKYELNLLDWWNVACGSASLRSDDDGRIYTGGAPLDRSLCCAKLHVMASVDQRFYKRGIYRKLVLYSSTKQTGISLPKKNPWLKLSFTVYHKNQNQVRDGAPCRPLVLSKFRRCKSDKHDSNKQMRALSGKERQKNIN